MTMDQRALLAIGLLCACLGCGRDTSVHGDYERRTGQSEQASYVGSGSCATCHEDLYASYQTHGMAQSLYPLTAENAVEDWEGDRLRHAPSGFFYVARRDGGRFVQEEYRVDGSGRKTHQLVREIDFVMGSGSAARTYLAEEDGRYYELPLTWYTQGGGHWGFSPGYAEANGRFDRAIPARCMACHNGVSEPVPFVEGKYTEIAMGIGCEQCHGPGSAHVEARLADPEPEGAIDATIVNPAHLDLDLRLDVCQQCHLHAEVSLLREGEWPFGYRPGQPLAAHLALYSAPSADADAINVISHADRMKASPCFRASAGAMDCTTCHDPHEGFREKGPEYFNATCLDCHAVGPLQAVMPTPTLRAQHTAGANCFSCHMPKVQAEDAPHASFTDHFIRVVERNVSPPTEGAETLALEPYFERDAEGEEAEIYRGMAYVVYGRQQGRRDALRRGVQVLDKALESRADFGEAQFLLGFARLQLGEPAAAIPALQRAVEVRDAPERLNALAQAYEATGRGAEAEPLYLRALAQAPEAADIRVNYGRLLEARNRPDEAVEQYRRAAQDEPWLAAAHYNLGTALLRRGETAAGERALQEAITLNPDHADALLNLAVVYARSGREGEAGELFERAAEVAPTDANVLSNVGTYRLQRGDLAGAQGVLERAVAADPQHVDARANLAVVRYQRGDVRGARQAAEAALRLNPQHPTALQVLQAVGG